MAACLNEHHFDAHRGVIGGPLPETTVVFGNDGYTQDPRASRVAELVRERPDVMEIAELGFGLAPPDGYTWAMLLHSDPTEPVMLDYLLDLVGKS
jgi:hypothetical protein